MDGFTVPDFQVSQDADHVYIDVSCQSNAAGMPNIAVEGRIFGFHLDPYYLPLVLTGAVTRPDSDAEALRISAQDDTSRISSSQSRGTAFRVTLNKINRGERFEGLEQVQPQLLPEDQLKQALVDAEQSKGFFQPPSGDGTGSVDVGLSAGNSAAVDEAAKALLQQALKSQGLTTMNDDGGEAAMSLDASSEMAKAGPSTGGLSWGFGWKSTFKGALVPAGCADTRNVLEVSDPGSVEPGQREQAATAFEEQRWDEGIYMDNFLDIDGELAHLMQFQPRIPSSTASSKPSIEDHAVDVEALALLLQLLFAYSYDERTNEGDPTVESGWTIVKLSRSLAASTLPSTPPGAPLESVVSSTLIGCVRRALTVPLYRHWELALACIHDALRRLDAGEACVRTCLDQIASRLEEGEDVILCRLSEIWLAPLIAHLPTQAQSEALAACIRRVMQQEDGVTKESVGGERWDLQVLEQAAKQALEDGEGGFV
ncbi:hypothetical protein EX895_001580 [Sporisorium graminicola]|uniref:Uncharacterized protein n=1 Tax=Sporisorium graminicola TaxID=280036 RepID=A0A4V6EU34_9BASI|nr:hypothetical protein EX895_001580 [Sporisorium graminicola]TKY89049.1 hypothetical protein EX895_001580 [Sporisorium graminicola]